MNSVDYHGASYMSESGRLCAASVPLYLPILSVLVAMSCGQHQADNSLIGPQKISVSHETSIGSIVLPSASTHHYWQLNPLNV